MFEYFDLIPIIEPCPFHALLIDAKAQGMDKMQVRTGARTEPGNGSCVLWYERFIKNHIEVGSEPLGYSCLSHKGPMRSVEREVLETAVDDSTPLGMNPPSGGNRVAVSFMRTGLLELFPQRSQIEFHRFKRLNHHLVRFNKSLD